MRPCGKSKCPEFPHHRLRSDGSIEPLPKYEAPEVKCGLQASSLSSMPETRLLGVSILILQSTRVMRMRPRGGSVGWANAVRY